jgi:hypothetical protein
MKETMLKDNKDSQELLCRMARIWMSKREMSYCEAIFHVLSLPLFKKSREVIFLATDFPENRVRTIKTFSIPSTG